MVRAPGGASYPVDRDLAQQALLDGRIPTDRVRVLFDPFKDEALVNVREVGILERAGLLKKMRAPVPLTYSQATARYDRLLNKAVAWASDAAPLLEEMDLGTAMDLAEGSYRSLQGEFEAVQEVLGYRRQRVVRTIAERLGG
jgi:hypothetical protein